MQKDHFDENNWREWEPAEPTGAVDPHLERQQEVSPFADEAGTTIRCRFCAMTIQSESAVCPCCGRNLSQSMKLNISYAVIAGICILGMLALVSRFNEPKIEEASKPALPQGVEDRSSMATAVPSGVEDRSSIATAISQGVEDKSSQAPAVLQGGEASSSQSPDVSQGATNRSAIATVHTWADSNRSAPTFADSPETVRRKYGTPDEDKSTQYANPRPPRVTRWIVYRKEKVRLTFTPDSPRGTPPPYKKWKPSYFQDAQSNAFILADEAKKRLASRLVRR